MKSKLQEVKERVLEKRDNRHPGDVRSYDIDQVEALSLLILIEYSKYYCNVSLDNLKSSCRKRELNMARFSAMWIAHFGYDIPLTLIGIYFGNRDHSTVIRGCRRLENWYETERKFRRYFDEVIDKTIKK